MKQKKNLLEEIKHNELMSKKDKMKRRTLNYFEHMLILTYALTGFVLISPFFFFFLISWHYFRNKTFCR